MGGTALLVVSSRSYNKVSGSQGTAGVVRYCDLYIVFGAARSVTIIQSVYRSNNNFLQSFLTAFILNTEKVGADILIAAIITFSSNRSHSKAQLFRMLQAYIFRCIQIIFAVLSVKLRYLAPPVKCSLTYLGAGRGRVALFSPVRAVTPGQSAVFYDGDRVLLGGFISLI